eukprot:2504786-Pyramimonas_sp.AAC.1
MNTCDGQEPCLVPRQPPHSSGGGARRGLHLTPPQDSSKLQSILDGESPGFDALATRPYHE